MRNTFALILWCCCLMLAAGCCCPSPPHFPGHGHGTAGHHAPHHYAEPHWPYYDQNGTPRVMGDSRLRHHLGVMPSQPAPVAELVR